MIVEDALGFIRNAQKFYNKTEEELFKKKISLQLYVSELYRKVFMKN